MVARYPPGLLVLKGDKRIGGAIGMWPITESAAARLRDSKLKESDLTGEMMQPFRNAPVRHWYISGIVLRPELVGTSAVRVLLGGGLCHWLYTAAIASPFQLLALASSHEGALLLARFGFYCYQKLTRCRTVLRCSLSTPPAKSLAHCCKGEVSIREARNKGRRRAPVRVGAFSSHSAPALFNPHASNTF